MRTISTGGKWPGLSFAQNTGGGVVTTQGGGGGFQTPDILNNESFETGNHWGVMTSWNGVDPPDNGAVTDNTRAKSGTWSVGYDFGPNGGSESGCHMVCNINPGYDRLWVRYYFFLTAGVSSIWKFSRFYGPNFTGASGGVFVQDSNGLMGWGADQEWQVVVDIPGITEAACLNAWHSLEIDYWKVGDPSGWPSVGFWLDNVQVTHVDQTNVNGQGANWTNNRIQYGSRANSNQIGWMEWLATLNAGNTRSGVARLDMISISSLGRIGP